MHKNMPPNWQPPAPAWLSNWHHQDALLVAYFAQQGGSPEPIDQWAKVFLNTSAGALSVEQAVYTDATGANNYIYISYWRQHDYLVWWLKAQQWWQQPARLEQDAGYWREVFTMPQDHFETLHSSPNAHGIGATTDELVGPIDEHGYAGGMRDRIALLQGQDAKAIRTPAQGLVAEYSANNQRVYLSLPANICMIRSGQNWSACDTEQKQDYLTNVHPVLQKGMLYLRDNPRDSGCYCMRLATKTDNNWQAVEQTFGLGYACDIYAFEDWAKSHPSHIAIFSSFMQMAGRYGENLQLQLWHEVAINPGQGSEAEYINCHRNTGFLAHCRS